MKHLRTTFVSLAVVASLLFVQAPAAKAYVFDGNYFTSAAISDRYLSYCFGMSTSDPVFLNRLTVGYGIRMWNDAISISWQSLGSCSGKTANVMVYWSNGYNYGYGGGVAAWTEQPGGSAIQKIHINSACSCTFYWGTDQNVPGNQYDIMGIAAHEMGHAFGLDHNPTYGAGTHLMSNGGPLTSTCLSGFNSERVTVMSIDDVNGFWARYPYLPRNTGVWPTSAMCYR